MDKPDSWMAFELLYWTGVREGELLALTPEDFDLERGTLSGAGLACASSLTLLLCHETKPLFIETG